MKAADIRPGARYLIQVVIPAGPATARLKLAQPVTVIAVKRSTVTVEALETVCVNLDQIPPDQHIAAMLTRRLRWEQRPVQRDIRAAEVLRPYPDDAGTSSTTDLSTARSAR